MSNPNTFLVWNECDSLLKVQANGEYGRKPLLVVRGTDHAAVGSLTKKLYLVLRHYYPQFVEERTSQRYVSIDKRFTAFLKTHYYCPVVLLAPMDDATYLRVAQWLMKYDCLPLAEDNSAFLPSVRERDIESFMHQVFLPEDVDVEEVQQVEEPTPEPEAQAPEVEAPEPEEVQPEPTPEVEVEQEQPAPEPQPSMSWNKVQILQYLVERGVAAPKQATKRELLALAK